MEKEFEIKLNKKEINVFITNLNHRMSNIEKDVTWIKRIIYYLAGIISIGVGKSLIFGG